MIKTILIHYIRKTIYHFNYIKIYVLILYTKLKFYMCFQKIEILFLEFIIDKC
jgi:hypothetical protein